MKRIILFFLIGLALGLKVASAQPNLIGQSPNSNTLKVSLDGKWLLTSTQFNDGFHHSGSIRLSVWNSTKYQQSARQITIGEYDHYGWTGDNRLYYLHMASSEIYSGKSLSLVNCEFEEPGGSGRVVCKITPNEWFKDFAFSADGSRFFLLTDSSYRIYDTHSGQQLSQRIWNIIPNKIGSFHYSRDVAYLSPEGERILATEQKRVDSWGSYGTGIRVVLEASTGKSLARIPNPITGTQMMLGDFLDEDIFANHEGDQDMSDVNQKLYRASDGKVVGTHTLPRLFYGLLTKDELVLTDLRTLKTVKYMPPRGAWRDIAISPDRKTLYVIDVDGKIFHFPSH